MASCSWLAKRLPAHVGVQLGADGTLRVFSATQDIGAIGLAGFAAVTAAVHYATGIRVRDLPITFEDLLPSTVTV